MVSVPQIKVDLQIYVPVSNAECKAQLSVFVKSVLRLVAPSHYCFQAAGRKLSRLPARRKAPTSPRVAEKSIYPALYFQ
jgi:hypothetical protein